MGRKSSNFQFNLPTMEFLIPSPSNKRFNAARILNFSVFGGSGSLPAMVAIHVSNATKGTFFPFLILDEESEILVIRFEDPETGEIVEYIPPEDEETNDIAYSKAIRAILFNGETASSKKP